MMLRRIILTTSLLAFGIEAGEPSNASPFRAMPTYSMSAAGQAHRRYRLRKLSVQMVL
jgi:hypothetical protein